jgi:hypothetical protein
MAVVTDKGGIVQMAAGDTYAGTGNHFIERVVFAGTNNATTGIVRTSDSQILVPAVVDIADVSGTVTTSGGLTNSTDGAAFVYIK